MIPIGGIQKKHFNLKDAEEFRAGFFVRKRLFETAAMHVNIYCIAPGQRNPLHRHPVSDEVLYFIEGTGECVVGGDRYEVTAGDVVFVPKDTAHAIRNTSVDANMVCILAQSPLPCEHIPVEEG